MFLILRNALTLSLLSIWLRRFLILEFVFNMSVHRLNYCPLIILKLLEVLNRLVLTPTLIAAHDLIQLRPAVVDSLDPLDCTNQNLWRLLLRDAYQVW